MARELSSVDTIVAEVATRINVLSADEEDNIITNINQCTRDVALTFPNAPFLQTSALQTLSAGTNQYPPDSDFEKMETIFNLDLGIKLAYLPTAQFVEYQPITTASASPTIYTILNDGTVQYRPTPNKAIDVEKKYKLLQSTVSAQSATPPLPVKYIELYALYGEFRGLRRQQRYNEATIIENEYEILKGRMRIDLMRRTSEAEPMRGLRDFDNISRDFEDPGTNIFWAS